MREGSGARAFSWGCSVKTYLAWKPGVCPNEHAGPLAIQVKHVLVAKVAASLVLDAKRDRKGLHLSHEVLRRQYFEILRRTSFASAPALRVKASLRDRDHNGRKDGRRRKYRKDIPSWHGGHFITGSVEGSPVPGRLDPVFGPEQSGPFCVMEPLAKRAFNGR